MTEITRFKMEAVALLRAADCIRLSFGRTSGHCADSARVTKQTVSDGGEQGGGGNEAPPEMWKLLKRKRARGLH